jgi:predicted cupin superfamily sugar epimerase
MHPDARRLIALLDLSPHPEGGFFRETWRASLPAGSAARDEPRVASTAIYFLLPAGAFSALHRVSSDEAWHHYEGDPVDLHLFDAAGIHTRAVLGHDLEAGERPQHVVPANVWQAAVVRGDRFALCGCTVAPGFDFRDFTMPSRADALALLPGHADLVTTLTRG